MTVPPLDGWVPLRLSWDAGRPMVDWFYLGTRRFTEPFFEDTLNICMRQPFNLVFRHRTPVEALADWQARQPGIAPTGFLFHLSRCGSTLICQMLAALERCVVLSEVGPIDHVVRADARTAGVIDDDRIAWLRGMVSALGQRRRGSEDRLFIKFDSWHTFDLPLIRRAFPEVPWLFLYRDPLEVLASQVNRPAANMVPGMFDPGRALGIPAADALQMPPAAYRACALGRLAAAAVDGFALGGGRLMNYSELADAVFTALAKHCGIRWTDAEQQRMRERLPFNAKTPSMFFTDDRAEKQQAPEPIRRLAEEWIAPHYRRLEAMRLAQDD